MIDIAKIRLENFEKIRLKFSSNAELARTLKRSPQQINDMLSGKKSFGPKIARYIETTLKLPSGYMDEPQNLEKTKLAEGKKIPVLSFVQAGLPTDSGQNCYDEWLDVAEDTPENAYALRIRGQSMEPAFHEGQVVIVNPNISPRPGDYVVVRLDSHDMNEATMKQYAVTGIDAYGHDIFELRPLNPLFPTLSSAENKICMLGVVIECRTRFR